MRVEDILPLSPLQEGLLFHALYDAQAPDVYTAQLVLGLEGRLTSERCGRRRRRCCSAMPACGPVPARRAEPSGAGHRAGGRAALAQDRSVGAGWRRSASSGWRALLAEDRAERFDLAVPPLIRFALIRLARRSIGW